MTAFAGLKVAHICIRLKLGNPKFYQRHNLPRHHTGRHRPAAPARTYDDEPADALWTDASYTDDDWPPRYNPPLSSHRGSLAALPRSDEYVYPKPPDSSLSALQGH